MESSDPFVIVKFLPAYWRKWSDVYWTFFPSLYIVRDEAKGWNTQTTNVKLPKLIL